MEVSKSSCSCPLCLVAELFHFFFNMCEYEALAIYCFFFVCCWCTHWYWLYLMLFSMEECQGCSSHFLMYTDTSLATHSSYFCQSCSTPLRVAEVAFVCIAVLDLVSVATESSFIKSRVAFGPTLNATCCTVLLTA